MMEETSDIFKVGDSFPSFELFAEKLNKFKKDNFVEVYIRDSITVPNAAKKGIKIPIKEDLGYYYLKYACVRGGKKFNTKGKGLRDTRLVTCNL